MHFIVEVLRVVKHERVPHVNGEILTIKVIVPSTALWHHEETQEFVGKN